MLSSMLGTAKREQHSMSFPPGAHWLEVKHNRRRKKYMVPRR
jgi:hypothetical protein